MQSMIIFAAALCLAQASYYAGPPAHIQLSPDGKYVLDTPEVAHAKAAHAAAYAQVAASGAHGGAWAPSAGYGAASYAAGAHYGAPAAGQFPSFNPDSTRAKELANPDGLLKYGPAPLAHDGRVLDTPEVAHLKAAHLAAHGAAHAAAAHGGLAHAGALAPLAYAAAPLSHGAGYGAGYAAGYGKWTGPQAHIQLSHDGQYVVDTPEVQHARAAHLSQYAAAAHAAASAPEEPWGQQGHGGWH